MCALVFCVPKITTSPKNHFTSCSLVEAPMTLMTYTLGDMGHTPYFITHKTRYSVSVHLKNDFSVFSFNSASTSFCKTFSRAFRWSVELFLAITIIFLYMYVPHQIPQIDQGYSPGRHQGCYNPPWVFFGTHNPPTIAQEYKYVYLQGINRYGNTPCLNIMMICAQNYLFLEEYILFFGLKTVSYKFPDLIF